jgi:hypothetical protein
MGDASPLSIGRLGGELEKIATFRAYAGRTLTARARQRIRARQKGAHDATVLASPLVYGPSAFSWVMPFAPASWPVDDDSMFAFHFEALHRAMEDAKPSLVAALATR